MDEARPGTVSPQASRAQDARRRALEDLRRLDPDATIPSPWISEDEVGERLLHVRARDPERVLGHLFALFRARVEAAVREVLEREVYVLDVAETTLRVFARLHRGGAGRAKGRDGEAEKLSFHDRLRSLAAQAVREGLYPDPADPPSPIPPGSFDPAVVRATHAAFNRLAREERLALRLAHLEGRTHVEVASALGTEIGSARESLRRARRNFVAGFRRSFAAGRRRERGPADPSERETDESD